MARTISVSEAKNAFSAVLDWAVNNNEAVIIDVRGKPKGVVLPYSQYIEYEALKEQVKPQENMSVQ